MSWRRRAAFVIAATCAAIAWLAWSKHEQAQWEKVMADKVLEREECVGRWCASVPDDFTRKGEDYSIGWVTLGEVQLGSGGPDAFDTAWSARLAEVADLRKPWMKADDVQGTIAERRTLTPHAFEAVLYHGNKATTTADWTALRGQDRLALALDIHVGMELKEQGWERIKMMAEAWRPRAPAERWPMPEPAFYLGGSAVVLPPKPAEEASASFRAAAKGPELSIETFTNYEEDKDTLLGRFGKAMAEIGARIAAIPSTVRSGGRKVAGLKGEELIIRENAEGGLICLWTFKGEPESSERPHIDLKMEARVESRDDEKVKLAMWDRFVESLRYAGP
jgi:hypothetical protein